MKNDSQNTRQHILDTGYRLVAKNGFANVGLSQLLKTAGVPKGSFYHYFNSKEAFGEALIQDYFAHYEELLEICFKNSAGNAYDRLMNYWQKWLETQTAGSCEQKCLVVKLSAEVSDLSDPMRLALLQGTQKVKAAISDCIAEGISEGSIVAVEPKATAAQLYHLWIGASLLSKLSQSADDFSQIMQTTQSIIRKTT
jgi:TetR/AcrR family transcriptional regulator, transcriptional repressor for nem operon